MKTPVNAESLKHHITYSWWKYALIAALCFGLVDLLYTVTAYRPPRDKTIGFYVYGYTNEQSLRADQGTERRQIMEYLKLTTESGEVNESPNTLKVFEGVMSQIAEMEIQLKELKASKEALAQVLLEQMEQRNIIKLETDQLRISYIAETDREQFNSKKFRADNPDLYDKYVDIVPVKANVRIKVK